MNGFIRAVLMLVLITPAGGWSVAAGPPDCHPAQAVGFLLNPDQFLYDPDDCIIVDTLPAEKTNDLLLPDLRTLPPSELAIMKFSDGTRELRLSNTIWNSGAGPLELSGVFDKDIQKTRVVQHIYTTQPGEPASRRVGDFIWHKNHDHWHYEQFSIYELWKLSPDGKLAGIVSSSDKVSYCVIDTDIVDREIEGFPSYRRYRGCGQSLQGLSVGWGDTYESFLDGQSIRLTGVEDGLYALVSTVNPNASLLEANYNNNVGIAYIEIHGEEIRMVDIARLMDNLCLNNPGVVQVPC